jgi:hypothetical protein
MSNFHNHNQGGNLRKVLTASFKVGCSKANGRMCLMLIFSKLLHYVTFTDGGCLLRGSYLLVEVAIREERQRVTPTVQENDKKVQRQNYPCELYQELNKLKARGRQVVL